MAVNHADGMMFTSVLICPVAAGVGAAHAGAGWFTVFFLPVGFGAALLLIRFGRPLVYAITGFGLNRSSRIQRGWMQQIFVAPFFLAYVILPLAIVWGGALALWAGSIWLVRHLF